MTRRTILYPLLFLLAFLTSCSKTDNPTSANPPFVNPGGVPSSSNTLTATIDGTDYKSVSTTGSKFVFALDTSFIVTSTLTNGTVELNINGYTTAGTYPIGPLDNSNRYNLIKYSYFDSSSFEAISYQTPAAAPGITEVGSVTITELTDTSLKATFNATLTHTKGSSGAETIRITNTGVNVRITK
jgi:hypothetical protein